MKWIRAVVNRILFILPALVVGVPCLFVVLTVLGGGSTMSTFFGFIGFLVLAALCFIPAVHRAERFLAARLLNAEVAKEPAESHSTKATAFAALHMAAGLAGCVAVFLLAVIFGELIWNAREVLTRGLPASAIFRVSAQAVVGNPHSVIILLMFIAAVFAPLLYLVTVPSLATALLGPDLQKRLVASEAARVQLTAQNDMARDIHDSVGHALTIASLQAESGLAQIDDAAAVEDSLHTILAVCRRTQADLDDVLRALRNGEPSAGTHVHGVKGIGDLIDDAQRAGLHVDVDIPLNLSLTPEHSRAVYRIIQESLTNALRYAEPKFLHIQVALDDNGGVHILADNPVTAQATPPGTAVDGRAASTGGRGLLGIEARVTLLGGQCSVGISGDRFVISVHLPAAVSYSPLPTASNSVPGHHERQEVQ